jgi:hypothetical protein
VVRTRWRPRPQPLLQGLHIVPGTRCGRHLGQRNKPPTLRLLVLRHADERALSRPAHGCSPSPARGYAPFRPLARDLRCDRLRGLPAAGCRAFSRARAPHRRQPRIGHCRPAGGDESKACAAGFNLSASSCRGRGALSPPHSAPVERPRERKRQEDRHPEQDAHFEDRIHIGGRSGRRGTEGHDALCPIGGLRISEPSRCRAETGIVAGRSGMAEDLRPAARRARADQTAGAPLQTGASGVRGSGGRSTAIGSPGRIPPPATTTPMIPALRIRFPSASRSRVAFIRPG